MRHTVFSRALSTGIFLSLTCGAGCTQITELFGGKKQEANAPETPAPRPPSIDPQELADQQMGEKLQGYIEPCLNKYSNHVLGSRARYAEWIADWNVGPTGREQNVFGVSVSPLGPDDTGADCAAAAERAAALPPESAELEHAAQVYAQSLQSLLPIIHEAHTYYEGGNYRDDGFAKGKALHPRLVAAYEAFATASTAFSDQVDQTNDAMQERRIAAAERDPARKLEAMVMSMYLKEQKLVRMAGRATVDESRKLAGVDAAEFAALTQGLETEMDALEAYKTGNEREWSQSRVGMFLADTKHFLNESKGMMRRLRDGTAFTESEIQMGRIYGSPEMLVERYNRVIQQLNNTRF